MRFIFWPVSVIAMAFALAASADPYVVVAKRTGLSAQSTQQHVLLRGEVVDGEDHDWDRNLLRVKYRGKDYLARKKYFRSKREALLQFDENRVAAEAEIKGINRQLEVNYKRLLKLQGAILQAEHDAAIHYKQRVGGAQVKGQGITIGESGAAGKLILILSDAKVRKAITAWDDELEALAKKTDKLHEERLAAVETVFGSALKRQQHKDLFQRFTQSPKTYLYVPSRTIDRNTQLFRKGAEPVSLRKGVWVLAARNRENTTTSHVRHDAKTYSTHTKYLKSGDELANEFLESRLALEDSVRLLENDIKMLAVRMEFYTDLVPDLKYRTHLKKDYVYIPKISSRPGADGMLKITIPEERLVIYALNIPRARKLLKKWDKDLENLEVELRRKSKKMGVAKKKLLVLKSSQEELQESLATFNKRHQKK